MSENEVSGNPDTDSPEIEIVMGKAMCAYNSLNEIF
jgi:hypothetical protein